MNNPTPDLDPTEIPIDASAEAPVADDPVPVEPPPDIRRRLRELLSIPERDRSDAVWDEIIELEIQLAPGNRIAGGPAPVHHHSNKPRQGGAPGKQAGGGAGGQAQNKHRPRPKTNRRPRQNKPQSGGSAA